MTEVNVLKKILSEFEHHGISDYPCKYGHNECSFSVAGPCHDETISEYETLVDKESE
jgi:hypothetical protein